MFLWWVVAFWVCNAQHQELDEDFRLTIAARNGDFQGMEVALLNGANINAVGDKRSGQTAIFAATLTARHDVVAWLLDKGADPNVPDAQGYSLWNYVCSMGLVELAKMLADRNIDPHRLHPKDDIPTLHRCAAVRRGDYLTPTLNHLLRIKGVDVDFRSRNKQITPLMVAAKYGNPWMAEILLQKGAKVNAQDIDGRIALYYGLYGLLNPDEIDTRDGNTISPEEHRKNHISVIKLLLENGGDPLIESKNGESPANMARTKCMHDPEVHQLFEDNINQQFEAAQKRLNAKEAKMKEKKKEESSSSGTNNNNNDDKDKKEIKKKKKKKRKTRRNK